MLWNIQIGINGGELCTVANFMPMDERNVNVDNWQKESFFVWIGLSVFWIWLSFTHFYVRSELYRPRPLTQRLHSNRIVSTNTSSTKNRTDWFSLSLSVFETRYQTLFASWAFKLFCFSLFIESHNGSKLILSEYFVHVISTIADSFQQTSRSVSLFYFVRKNW